MEAMRKSAKVKSVELDPQAPDVMVVTLREGGPFNMVIGGSRRAMPAALMTDEQYLARAKEQFESWQQRLRFGGMFVRSSGGEMYMGPREAVQWLESAAGQANDRNPQDEAMLAKAGNILGPILAKTKFDEALKKRVALVKREVEFQEKLGEGPKEIEDFDVLAKKAWREFADTQKLAIGPGVEQRFVDLDEGRLIKPPADMNLDDERATLAWARKAGVDAWWVLREFEHREPLVGLRWVDGFGYWSADESARTLWKDAHPDVLLKELQEQRERMKKGQEIPEAMLNRVATPSGELPYFVAYQTKAGASGIMLISQVADDVMEVQLRRIKPTSRPAK